MSLPRAGKGVFPSIWLQVRGQSTVNIPVSVAAMGRGPEATSVAQRKLGRGGNGRRNTYPPQNCPRLHVTAEHTGTRRRNYVGNLLACFLQTLQLSPSVAAPDEAAFRGNLKCGNLDRNVEMCTNVNIWYVEDGAGGTLITTLKLF